MKRGIGCRITLGLALALLAGCGTPTLDSTGVLVFVHLDQTLCGQLDSVRVRVRGAAPGEDWDESEERRFDVADCRDWPKSIAISPAGSADRQFRIELAGFAPTSGRSREALVTSHHEGDFVEGEWKRLHVALYASCSKDFDTGAGETCTEAQRCTANGCEALTLVAAGSLPSAEPADNPECDANPPRGVERLAFFDFEDAPPEALSAGWTQWQGEAGIDYEYEEGARCGYGVLRLRPDDIEASTVGFRLAEWPAPRLAVRATVRVGEAASDAIASGLRVQFGGAGADGDSAVQLHFDPGATSNRGIYLRHDGTSVTGGLTPLTTSWSEDTWYRVELIIDRDARRTTVLINGARIGDDGGYDWGQDERGNPITIPVGPNFGLWFISADAYVDALAIDAL